MAAEPFYFGRNEHLFGFFHPADHARRNHAVVVCPPLLNEYMRSHHALRRVALTLADSGYDVLRFDFSGQGNSAGVTSNVTCDDWGDDVGDALTEIEAIAGTDKVSVVAVRFACSLAARHSQSRFLHNLVCWDPIFDGAAWLEILRRVKRRFEAESRAAARVGEYEYMGHQTSRAFVSTLEKHRYEPGSVGNSVVVETIGHHTVNRDSAVSVPFNCRWEEMSSQILYPHDVIGELCRPFVCD